MICCKGLGDEEGETMRKHDRFERTVADSKEAGEKGLGFFYFHHSLHFDLATTTP